MNETNDKWKKVKIGEFLTRYKEPVNIIDEKEYKQVTIRTNHQGIKLRKAQLGKKIGTKKQFIVHKGLFLMSKIDARYGAFGIVPQELDGAIITGNFWAYVVKEDIIDIDYFNQYTNSPDFYELCERASSGITHRKYLQENEFLKFEIEIPDLTTQKQIYINNRIFANRIDTISDSMYQRDNILTSLRQQILQDAITGKLSEKWRKENPTYEPAEVLLEKIKAEKEKLIREGKIKKQKPLSQIDESEIPFELPEGWIWCRLGEILTKLTDGAHQTPRYVDAGIPFLSVKDISSGKIDFSNTKYITEEEHSELYSRCNAEFGDVLLTKVGTTGIAKVVDTHREFSLFVSVALLKFNQDLVYNYFLEYLINSPFVKRQSENETKGMGNQNLVLSKISNFLIPLPSIGEQHHIVARIESLLTKLDRIKETHIENQTNIDQINYILLKDMFKG